MMLSGMEGWFTGWKIDSKRPTNAAKNDRKQQSERDKKLHNALSRMKGRKAVTHGCAEYNSTTGQFQWKGEK